MVDAGVDLDLESESDFLVGFQQGGLFGDLVLVWVGEDDPEAEVVG